MCRPGVQLKRGRAFMLTINNPTAKPAFPEGCKYVYQKEKGENGTEHYQCYVTFPKPYTRKMLADLKLGHWCNRMGTHDEALAYVTKEDTRIEEGENTYPTYKSGARSDLELAKKKIVEYAKDGCWADVMNDDEICMVVSKSLRWARNLFEQNRYTPNPVEGFVPRPWQKDLLDVLDGPADSRKIIWIHDSIGNVGKSYMAQYLRRNLGAFVSTGSNAIDFSYIYDKERIVVFDLGRVTNMDHVSYASMENLKNGYMLSTKYEPIKKCFDPPHVVVFSNQACPEGKLSVDRLCNSTWDLDNYVPLSVAEPVETEVLPLVSDVVNEVNDYLLVSDAESEHDSPPHKRSSVARGFIIPPLPNSYNL